MVNLFCCYRPKKKNPIPKLVDRSLPDPILELVFSQLDDSGSKGLYSCLTVNSKWNLKARQILWKRPFTSKPLSQENSIKLIRTLLLCLDTTTKQMLRALLKDGRPITNIIPNESPLFNYASLMNELDYKEFEISIQSYLLNFMSNLSIEHIHLIAKSLFILIMRTGSTFRSLIIDKFSEDYANLPITEIQLQRKSNYLSRITKLNLNYYESSDIFDFLRLLPTICNDLLEFTVTICDFENEALVNRSVADVISSQRALKKFSMDGARNGGNTILIALGGSQSKTLTSAKFRLMNFKSAGMRSLAKCSQLKELLFENCQGLTIEITKILYNAKLKNLKNLIIWNYHKVPTVTSLLIKSTMNSELKELTLDIMIIGTVNTILEHCPNITTLKIFDYQPKHNIQMFRLLKGLPNLERLTIYRETKVELGVINFSGNYLPNNLKYLRLECGISSDQLDNLLKGLRDRSKLKILIIDYFKTERSHLKVIVEWVKRSRTLKFLGIGGKSIFSKGELTELNILQKEYGVSIIPSHKFDYY
ncbi:hypothetical protein C1645_747131 [Glomus cerebriforme]|uniref:F-box domain-containing protein n=1 Tax=Glomus cerebriforme TaxID=658196 RepID=A0A397TSF2_9GLOM|nr:hypothetical protein C1645_747131 [Glomus cerebriforme]